MKSEGTGLLGSVKGLLEGGLYLDIITFGKREEGKEYIIRPAVYCLILSSKINKVAIIQTSDGKYFLPGGGIEDNETHEDCLKREALEELGMVTFINAMFLRK